MAATSIYSASLIQTGTNAPTATSPGKNNLTGTWTRVSAGSYLFTVSGSSEYTLGTTGSLSGSIAVNLTFGGSGSLMTSSAGYTIPVGSTSSLYIYTQTSDHTNRFIDNVLSSNVSCSINITYDQI